MITSAVNTRRSKAVVIQERNVLRTFVGDDVLNLVSDEAFEGSWQDLYKQCEWATVFQSPAFVATWYQVFYQEYLPIAVTYEVNGKLNGILTLAKSKSGLIFGAGETHAEYQGWLATEQDSEVFIVKALAEVRKHFPKSAIQFKYIPGKTSLQWLRQDKKWRRSCLLEVVKQPLLIIDAVSMSNEIRNKHNRHKINQLKRVGELKFERITDSALFTSVFDDLILQYDFRKSAMYNITFFQDGGLSKNFFLKLFEKNLLHATVLKLNEEIIASTIGTNGKNNCYHLKGVNTHSLFYSKNSPGYLHMLMLGELLAKEGVEIFDLTPGADAYKGNLATDYSQVYKLTIDRSYKQVLKRTKITLVDIIKKSATAVGIKRLLLKKTKWQLFRFINKIALIVKQGLFVTGREGVNALQTSKKYVVDTSTLKLSSEEELVSLKKNSLSDLMKFKETKGEATRWQFHAEAMRRFEGRQNCFSWAKDDCLLCCVWYRSSTVYDVEKDSDAPVRESVELHSIYCYAANLHLLPAFLKAAALQVAAESGRQKLYAVSTSNALHKALEMSGFHAV